MSEKATLNEWERGPDAVRTTNGVPEFRPQWGDRRVARFQPKRTDDLRPGALQLVGKVCEFEFAGTMNEGPYAGQPIWELADRDHWIGWVPDEDLAGTL